MLDNQGLMPCESSTVKARCLFEAHWLYFSQVGRYYRGDLWEIEYVNLDLRTPQNVNYRSFQGWTK